MPSLVDVITDTTDTYGLKNHLPESNLRRMIGPHPRGTFKPIVPPSAWEASRMVRGKQYQVIKAFKDANGDEHLVGENWVFLMKMFNRFDDELNLCVLSASGEEWRIPLIWKREGEQEVIENVARYVSLVEPKDSIKGELGL
jgi:hypothetical protein